MAAACPLRKKSVVNEGERSNTWTLSPSLWRIVNDQQLRQYDESRNNGRLPTTSRVRLLAYDLHSLSELSLWLIEFERGRPMILFLVGILPFCMNPRCMVLGFQEGCETKASESGQYICCQDSSTRMVHHAESKQ